jgi:hypothetical protein
MNAKLKPREFPLPSSVTVIPGTERAQAGYPYHIQFSKTDDRKFWFYNSMHFPEPMSAFDMVTAEAADHARYRSPNHQWPGLHRRQRGYRS